MSSVAGAVVVTDTKTMGSENWEYNTVEGGRSVGRPKSSSTVVSMNARRNGKNKGPEMKAFG